MCSSDLGTYIVCIFQLGLYISYVLTLPSVGDYEHHTATSGLHASGSGSAWGSGQEDRSHAVEDLSNWCNIFNTPTPGYPTQPSQGNIYDTPPPNPTQATQDGGDITMPRQLRHPDRLMWTPLPPHPTRYPRPPMGE